MTIQSKSRAPRRIGLAAFAFLALGTVAAGAAGTDADPYVLEVANASTGIGAETAVVATMRLRDGYRFLQNYNNRVIKLSSFDDGVAFERKVVRGTIRDGSLVFRVNVSPTKPGDHPINGVIRVGYAEGTSSMRMITVPLMATVTGTD